MNGEIKKATDRIAVEGRTSAAGRADAAALSDLTAVRASTVLDIDAVKKQLAGEDTTAGQVAAGASVIQPASPGRQSSLRHRCAHVRPGRCGRWPCCSTTVYLLVTNRRDPKLRSRDEIADAVGIPVITSVRVRPPRSAHGWRELLRGYTPDSPDAWALRQLLHGLVPESGRSGPRVRASSSSCSRVSGDTAGLAVGPQIASFAASNGIATQLFAAQQHESATTLWAACSPAPVRDDLPAAPSPSPPSRTSSPGSTSPCASSCSTATRRSPNRTWSRAGPRSSR